MHSIRALTKQLLTDGQVNGTSVATSMITEARKEKYVVWVVISRSAFLG